MLQLLGISFSYKGRSFSVIMVGSSVPLEDLSATIGGAFCCFVDCVVIEYEAIKQTNVNKLYLQPEEQIQVLWFVLHLD